MDGNTLQQIKTSLLDRWTNLGQNAGRDIQSGFDQDQSHAEIIDMAQSLEQMDRDTSLAEQERREMLAIEKALAKMSTGNFGVCEDCSEEIPAKRLVAIPSARLCANCQAFEERQSSRMRVVGGSSRL